nr:hypothetical protein [Tanacetum cinerariifolium]
MTSFNQRECLGCGQPCDGLYCYPYDTHELLHKLIEDLQIISEELAEYINSPSWNRPAFYDNDDEHSIQYKEYLENSSNAIAPVLPTEEPDYSLSMGDEHLSTILETKSDEVIKSSVKNLVPIPSEYEVTFDNENFTSSDDESLSNEDVLMENFKIYSNPLFDDEEIISTKIDPHYFNAESNLIEYLLNRDILINSSPKFDYLLELAHIDLILPGIKEADFDLEEEIRLVENLLYYNSSPRPPKELNAEIVDMIVESLSPHPIPIEDRDIHFLKELLSNDSLPLSKNELSNFDHHDDPLFLRPPPKRPDVEVFFEPDSGVLTTKVVKGMSEYYVHVPNILPTLPTFDPLYPVYDTLLRLLSKNEDKVFKPGILSYLLVSHRDKVTSDFSENPVMMYGGDIPLLDVPYLHFYPP